jgi:hypothetical protein
MILAAYKGTRPGISGLYNKLGRRIAQGPYSHSELIFPEEGGISWSSSYIDGGVRGKHIGYSSVGHWDFFEIPASFDHAKALSYFKERDSWGYDVRGNLRFGVSIVFPSDDKHKLFCSEAIAEALGLPDPFKQDPCSLVNILVYLGAKQQGHHK